MNVELFIEDPIGQLINVDLNDIVLSDIRTSMTEDTKQKAKEVVVPTIIASQIVSASAIPIRRIK